MLFKANIPSSLIVDEDALVSQMYVFLNEFVKTRLKFESEQTIEDCVQDTILYLVSRVRKLQVPAEPEFNLEQFLYNRANSYISSWLRRLVNNRKQFKKYCNELEYVASLEAEDKPIYIDYGLLDSLINKLPLAPARKQLIQSICILKLIALGYTADAPKDISMADYADTAFDTLAYNIIDEYLILDIQ